MNDRFLKLLTRFLIYSPLLLFGLMVVLDLIDTQSNSLYFLFAIPILIIFWALALLYKLDRQWSLIAARIMLLLIGVFVAIATIGSVLILPQIEGPQRLSNYIRAFYFVIPTMTVGGFITWIAWLLSKRTVERAKSKKLESVN